MKAKIIILILMCCLMSSCKLAELFGGNRGGGGGGGGYGGGDFNPQDFGLDPQDFSYGPEQQNQQFPGYNAPEQMGNPNDGAPNIILPDQNQNQVPPNQIGQVGPQGQSLPPQPPPPAGAGPETQVNPQSIAGNTGNQKDPLTQVIPPVLEQANGADAKQLASVGQTPSAEGAVTTSRAQCDKQNETDLLNIFPDMKKMAKRCDECDGKTDKQIEGEKKYTYYTDFANLKKDFSAHDEISWDTEWPKEMQGDEDDKKIARKKYLYEQIDIVLNGDDKKANFPGIKDFDNLYDNPETAAKLVKYLDEKQEENIVDLVKDEQNKLACLRDKLCPMERKDV